MRGVFGVETLLVVIVSVVVNLLVPMVVRPFATPEQIKPPNGADKLPFVDQLMHMFVHHAQVPVSSSVIIVVIVLSSIVLGKQLAKML